MENKIDDGGPAFPTNQEIPKMHWHNEDIELFEKYGGGGLSKLEWFAGMALFGAMLADIERAKNGHVPSTNCESELADTCYRIADAMIAEGKKENGK